MKRQCLECCKKVVGRIDKKFCCDECRNDYNNGIKINLVIIKDINTALRRNRRILEELGEKSKVDKTTLLQKGFNFKYHTHTHTTAKKEIYYYCYEYGYKLIDKDLYFLVKQRE